MALTDLLVTLKLTDNISIGWGWILFPLCIGFIYACIMQYLWYKSPEQIRFRKNHKKIKDYLNK